MLFCNSPAMFYMIRIYSIGLYHKRKEPPLSGS